MSAELRPCGILGDRWKDMDLLGDWALVLVHQVI